VVERLFHGQCDPFHHGVEQVRLVLEMPVHRAARGAGPPRDVLQAGARHPLALKQVLGRIQQLVAGGQSFFFCPTDHSLSPATHFFWILFYTFTNVCKL
jgi:hypothetical protein